MIRQRFRWLLLAGLAVLPSGGCMQGTLAPPEDSLKAAKNELPKDQPAAIYLSTASQMEKANDAARAIQCYEKAKELDPSCEDAIAHRLAILYDKTGEATKAMAEYQRALERTPRNSNLFNDMGQHFALVGNLVEAEAKYRRSLELESKNNRARGNLALVLALQRRDAEAVAEWQKLTGHAEALYNDGFVQLTQGRRDEARATFREALNIDPTFRRAQAALTYLDKPRPGPETPLRSVASAPPAPAATP